MDADQPIKSKNADRLGFAPLAEKLARIIRDQSSTKGLVLGIDGEWGSGKSSLLALIEEQIIEDEKYAVLNFRPWLIGDRDNLIATFFDELAVMIKNKDCNVCLFENEEDRQTAIKNLERYAILTSSISTGFKIAGTIMPGMSGIGAVLEGLQKLAENQKAATENETLSLGKQKEMLVESLEKLKAPLIVIIDDLDRLEPMECSEIMRLIKAVANFPNIIYVLAYDRNITGHLLEKGLNIKDGQAYLGKIVQVSFRIPKPESLYLRSWLNDEILGLFPEILNEDSQKPFSLSHEVSSIVDKYCGLYLKTPRQVVRTLNAIRLYGIPVKEEIYLPDMIFLQLVSLGHPELYKWIEDYVMIAVTSKNWSTEQQRTDLYNRLIEIFPNEDELNEAIHSLGDRLPGISRDPAAGMFHDRDEKKFHVLNMSGDDFDPFIRDHRLASPDHYRFYFALTQPEGTLLESEVEAFIALVQQNRQQATEQFKKYATKPSQQGKSLAEWLLNRLYILDMHVSSPLINKRCNLLEIMADNIDEMEIKARKNFSNNVLHKQAVLLGERLLKRLPKTEPSVCLKELFEQGKSLGWLNSIFKSEIFAHGLFGDRKRTEDEWLFTADEFEQIRQIMLKRYRALKRSDLTKSPNPFDILFGWQQGTDKPEEVNKWVEKQIKTDKGLLDFLTRIRSRGEAKRVSRGDGIPIDEAIEYYYSLDGNALKHFMDIDKLRQRLETLAANEKNKKQAALASDLLEALKNGDRW